MGRRRGQPRSRIAQSPASATIVVVCVCAFLVTLSLCWRGERQLPGLQQLWSLAGCGGALRSLGALVLVRVWEEGQWWRVLSTIVLHGSWLHLGLNAWSLWIVGEWAERLWGSWTTGGVFVLSGVAGSLASLAWAEAPVVVGASGGVLGVASGLWIVRIVGSDQARARIAPISPRTLGGSLIALIALGAVVPVIAQAGHVGGLAWGLFAGLGLSGRSLALRWLGRGGVVVGLGVLAWVAAHPIRPAARLELVGFTALAEGDFDRAMDALSQVHAGQPDDPEMANALAYALAQGDQRLPRAEELVRGALETDPDNPDYLDTLGWILCRRGEVAAGLEQLRAAQLAAERDIPEIAGHIEACAGARSGK